MVQLSFIVQVEAELDAVWGYFSDFKNITQWDPNTRGCAVLKEVAGWVGSSYRITTVFNDKESDVVYTTQKFTKSPTEGYINLFGENDMITANDEIICRTKGHHKTEVEYRADICLRGFAVLFTPFILCSLNKITEDSRLGLRNKARELWGKAE